MKAENSVKSLATRRNLHAIGAGMSSQIKIISQLSIEHEKLADYCERKQIAQLALFGSFLSRDFGPNSDLDLLVTFQPGARIGFLAFNRIQRELSELFGRNVDLVPQKGLKPAIRQAVLDSSEILYAAR